MNLLKQTIELKDLQTYLGGYFICRMCIKWDDSETDDNERIIPLKEIRFLSKREALSINTVERLDQPTVTRRRYLPPGLSLHIQVAPKICTPQQTEPRCGT